MPRFVAATPAMRAAMLCACAFFFASAVWALLPLIVRERLQLGPAAFGLMLAVVGGGAVAGTRARASLNVGNTVSVVQR